MSQQQCLSNRYIATRKLPDKAIDLIDEAASKRKIELKSKPVNAEKIENQIIKNKIEIESLKSDKDNSNERIQTLENDNKELNSSLDIILKEWKSYEEKINNLNLLKEDLENKKIELKSAERKET